MSSWAGRTENPWEYSWYKSHYQSVLCRTRLQWLWIPPNIHKPFKRWETTNLSVCHLKYIFTCTWGSVPWDPLFCLLMNVSLTVNKIVWTGSESRRGVVVSQTASRADLTAKQQLFVMRLNSNDGEQTAPGSRVEPDVTQRSSQHHDLKKHHC